MALRALHRHVDDPSPIDAPGILQILRRARDGDEDAAKKLIYLALRGVAAKWKRPPQYWARVKAEFAIRFEERFKLETE